jgi:hypothetical protein
MDHRQLVRMLAAARVVAGTALLLAPGKVGGRWIGAHINERTTMMFVRAMGARDLALGLGTLRALERDEAPRNWVAASAFADAADVVATVIAGSAIGARRAVPIVTLAGLSAAVGARSLDQLT